jgi:hypothetical protein
MEILLAAVKVRNFKVGVSFGSYGDWRSYGLTAILFNCVYLYIGAAIEARDIVRYPAHLQCSTANSDAQD